LDAHILLIHVIFVFLEFFQKPPDGWWITARQHIIFCTGFGFLKRNRLAAPPWPPGDT